MMRRRRPSVTLGPAKLAAIIWPTAMSRVKSGGRESGVGAGRAAGLGGGAGVAHDRAHGVGGGTWAVGRPETGPSLAGSAATPSKKSNAGWASRRRDRTGAGRFYLRLRPNS